MSYQNNAPHDNTHGFDSLNSYSISDKEKPKSFWKHSLREASEIVINNNYYVLNLLDCFSQELHLAFPFDSLHESASSIQPLAEI